MRFRGAIQGCRGRDPAPPCGQGGRYDSWGLPKRGARPLIAPPPTSVHSFSLVNRPSLQESPLGFMHAHMSMHLTPRAPPSDMTLLMSMIARAAVQPDVLCLWFGVQVPVVSALFAIVKGNAE